MTWPELQATLDRSVDALDRRRGVVAARRPAVPVPSKPPTPARPLAPSPPARRATPRPRSHDRETLRRVALVCGSPFIRAEIRRAYIAETGLPITLEAVRRFLVDELGLPRVGPGEHAGGRGWIEARRGVPRP
jgi:hypothetical protein